MKKQHFFSIFWISKFLSILTTFDPDLSWKRTGRIRDFLKFSWKWQKWLQNSRTSNWGLNTTRNHHGSLSLTHGHIRKLFIRSFGRPGKSYVTATFWYFQKNAPQGCWNGRPGPHFGQNLKSGRFLGFFNSRVLIYKKKPVFLIYGSGGFYKRAGAQNCQNRVSTSLGRLTILGPPISGSKTHLRFFTEFFPLNLIQSWAATDN